jgi:hypothetical protein
MYPKEVERLLNELQDSRILPTYQNAVALRPTYLESCLNDPRIANNLVDTLNPIGNINNYHGVNEFPESRQSLLLTVREQIITFAIQNNISTANILSSPDSVLIKYPWRPPREGG